MTNKLARLAAAPALLLLASVCAAQGQAAGAPQPRRPRATPAGAEAAGQRAGGAAEEDFELNITERRFVEENFAASTAVEAVGAGDEPLSLRVGAAVGAERIDVLLRNVRGHVRFRGTLGPLARLVITRRAAPAAPPPPASP